MTDTAPEIQRLVQARLMSRSSEERFIMGAEMFEAAREMVKASLRRDLPQAIRKRQLFHRIYGQTLPAGMGTEVISDPPSFDYGAAGE